MILESNSMLLRHLSGWSVGCTWWFITGNCENSGRQKNKLGVLSVINYTTYVFSKASPLAPHIPQASLKIISSYQIPIK